MDIVQASFQASFDSRVERLGDGDLADLRVIFRYFDTDGDGAVSASQACRMFALLGLDVNMTQVRELGEVYLNEFMKIVDSHVHVAPPSEAQVDVLDGGAQAPPPEGGVPAQEIPVQSAEETARRLWNDKKLEDEWKMLDTYRRGRVSVQELGLFLGSCRSTLSLDDTERFLETYGSTVEHDGVEELEFTKEGFLKFRHEYTPRKMAPSEDDLSSDDDDEDGLVDNAVSSAQRPADSAGVADATSAANATTMRLPSRHAKRGPSDVAYSSSDPVLSSRDHEFVVNPDELVESDESDEEAGSNDMLPPAADGQMLPIVAP
ncbi:hypothetical protein PRIC1_014618 [Phytophthora ramorum]